MDTVLSILAVSVILTTSHANLVEFEETVFHSSGLFNPAEKPCKVKLVNPMHKMDFVARAQQYQNKATFDLARLPDPVPVPDFFCGSLMGIYIDALRQTFCNVTSFTIVSIPESSGPQNLQFHIDFHNVNTGSLIILIVPVYQIPSKVESNNNSQLKSWGDKRGVDVVGPVNASNLLAAASTRLMTIEFTWLNRLLRFGVYSIRELQLLPNTKIVSPTYVTRPVVISERTLNMCNHVVSTLNKERESVGSNSPRQ